MTWEQLLRELAIERAAPKPEPYRERRPATYAADWELTPDEQRANRARLVDAFGISDDYEIGSTK